MNSARSEGNASLKKARMGPVSAMTCVNQAFVRWVFAAVARQRVQAPVALRLKCVKGHCSKEINACLRRAWELHASPIQFVPRGCAELPSARNALL